MDAIFKEADPQQFPPEKPLGDRYPGLFSLSKLPNVEHFNCRELPDGRLQITTIDKNGLYAHSVLRKPLEGDFVSAGENKHEKYCAAQESGQMVLESFVVRRRTGQYINMFGEAEELLHPQKKDLNGLLVLIDTQEDLVGVPKVVLGKPQFPLNSTELFIRDAAVTLAVYCKKHGQSAATTKEGSGIVVMRLPTGNLSLEVLTHEIGHAARNMNMSEADKSSQPTREALNTINAEINRLLKEQEEMNTAFFKQTDGNFTDDMFDQLDSVDRRIDEERKTRDELLDAFLKAEKRWVVLEEQGASSISIMINKGLRRKGFYSDEELEQIKTWSRMSLYTYQKHYRGIDLGPNEKNYVVILTDEEMQLYKKVNDLVDR